MVGKLVITERLTRVIELGEANAEKTQLECYFERHDTETTNVMTNLAVLRTLIEHQTETKKFFEYAPSFLAISWHNAWFTTVVLLCSLLKTKSEGSLYGLLAFAETNQAQIFTKEVFEADAPLDGKYLEEDLEWKKINTESPEAIIKECRTTLDNRKGDIDLVFSVRDKVYAHFDIISIDGEQKTILLDQINFGLLESLAKLVADVLNRLHAIYDQKFIFYDPIQGDDLLNFYDPLCFYEKHAEQAADEEVERIMSEANK
jgi:hypothetical protein